jgi:glycosyltransferase involved in cell wall biosynthesis
MRVAFYAPLKPPDHPVPSGDRRMARLLVEALERAGHQVELASRLRSRDPAGDAGRQARLERIGAGLARRLLRRYGARAPAERPRAWLTYHLYDKAPDWIGPAVAQGLGIPYLAAEASLAPSRADGPWARGHRATLAALERAAAVIVLNPDDLACLPERTRTHTLKPFLDPAPFRAAAARRAEHRATLAEAEDLDPARPWLLAVGMMRPGDKLDSYRLLAKALARAGDLDWRLLVAGDGPARDQVREAFSAVPADRLRFLGEVSASRLATLYAACDLLVWPAVNEAYGGMALLEAQAAGLPVLAGRCRGVGAVVRDQSGGVLVEPEDAGAFAAGLDGLLADPDRLRALGATAAATVAAEHGIDRAARGLDAILRAVAGA